VRFFSRIFSFLYTSNFFYYVRYPILDTGYPISKLDHVIYQARKKSVLTIYSKATCKDSDYYNDLRLAPPASRRIKLRAFDVAVEKRESREELNDYRSLFSASSLKSWSCYRCGKRYMWRDSLKKHLRIECGKDPTFECPICGRKFKHKHRWQSHARLIHYINM